MTRAKVDSLEDDSHGWRSYGWKMLLEITLCKDKSLPVTSAALLLHPLITSGCVMAGDVADLQQTGAQVPFPVLWDL